MRLRSGANAAKSNTATATTGTAEDPPAGRDGSDRAHSDVNRSGRRYVGRFAPSPTGELHLGSLYAAVASYLDARALGGRWLVRMEDLDSPRTVAGAAERILATLEAFGFEWDGEPARQSRRRALYAHALESLHACGLTFECSCSRLNLAEFDRYPGFCRSGVRIAGVPTATRLKVEPGHVTFEDRIHGAFRQDVAAKAGDLTLRRRDGIYAYLLAVVVDDAHQGITHVVRGADLLDDTPCQIYLQRALGLATPAYAHVSVLREPDGTKLAKSRRSIPLDPKFASAYLVRAFELLGLEPPPSLQASPIGDVWSWGISRWHPSLAPRRIGIEVFS